MYDSMQELFFILNCSFSQKIFNFDVKFLILQPSGHERLKKA